MDWSHVTATQNDDAFFEDYVRLALACEPPELPARLQRLGSVAAGWFPTLPGTAHIFAQGGTPLDRAFAFQVIATQLEGHGIKPASYSLDWDLADEALIKEAGWPDIQAKATRLVQEGNVKITGNARDIVTGVVKGDHGTYNTEIQRQDPESQTISMWSCECLVPGTPIVMHDGSIKLVEEVESGDIVLTASGKPGVVTKTLTKRYRGKLRGMRIEGSTETVWMTHNHRLPNPAMEFKEAKDWKAGDYTFMPIMDNPETSTIIDVAQHVSGLVEREGWLYKPNRLFGSNRVRRASRPTSSISPRQNPIPARIVWDSTFAYLSGLFVAEGIATSRGELRWSFNTKTEQHLADCVIEMLGQYGLDNAKKSSKNGSVTVAVQSKPMADLFRSLFGTGARSKRLHADVMNMSSIAISCFFGGWFDGDGHEGQNGRDSLATVSPHLAMQARLILARCGHESVLRHKLNNSSPLVPGGKDIYVLAWRREGGRGRNARWFENDRVHQRMLEPEIKDYDGLVHDFEVADDHTFVIAPGIASSNCKWDQFAWQRTRQWKRLEGRVCVMPDTLITMANGTFVPIEEVEVGDKVLTHNGIGTVTQTMRNDYVGAIYSIYRCGFPHPLQVTKNHEVWSVRTPDKVRNAKYNADLSTGHGFRIYDDSFVAGNPQWIDSQDLHVHDWVASTWIENTVLSPGDHFATVLGYYLAEGNLARNPGRDWTEIQWTFHEDEGDLVENLKISLAHLSSGDVRIYDYPSKSTVSVRITDRNLAQELLKYGGQHARAKKLHPAVMRWSTQNLETLLEAHYQGDGTQSPDGRRVHYTASDGLAHQIYEILVKCGYIPSWTEAKNNGGPNNRDAIVSMQRIAYKKQKAGKGNGRRRFETRYLSKITEILECDYEGPVYNLAVDGQESYVANGVVVHNCSHVLATYWQALGMPFDEDIGPGAEEPQAPEGGEGGAVAPGQGEPPAPQPQSSPFAQVPGGGTGMVPPAGTPGPGKPGLPNQQAPTPEPAGGIPGQAPEPRSLIPQYPQDPALQPAINPISVPGQKPQTPLNPIQNPGGTFSHVRESAATFTNGDMVQLKQEDYGQTVGLNSGDTKLIPANSQGEVLGVDPLGLVNVYFAGPQAQAGRMEPHGVTAWLWPKDLIPRPDVPPAGPAIQRR